MTYLLDTNVVSELVRPAPDARVAGWAASLDQAALSVISLDEVQFGLAFKPNVRLQRLIDLYVESYCTVLEVTAVIAKHAGILRGQLARRGRARSQADMLIAATASAHGLTLATRNRRDFDGCGVALFDPWT